MTESSNYPVWDTELKSFLKEWFSGLMAGIERSNDETWPKVLEMTGRACSHIHSGELFIKTWESTKNIDDFIFKINKDTDEVTYEKLDNYTLFVSYSKCKCPLVRFGFVASPLLCECTPNWLLENFETILEKSVTVKTENTILRGAKKCSFIISIENDVF
ncbi:MAG: hypothetical protein ACFE95_12810 [Candidatus Hodarchaeota archaeon]